MISFFKYSRQASSNENCELVTGSKVNDQLGVYKQLKLGIPLYLHFSFLEYNIHRQSQILHMRCATNSIINKYYSLQCITLIIKIASQFCFLRCLKRSSILRILSALCYCQNVALIRYFHVLLNKLYCFLSNRLLNLSAIYS